MLKSIIPRKYHKSLSELRTEIFDGYAVKSYSQEGEDMILRRLFEKQRTGFYVDVGAHHPKRFSNTYFFYKRGWRGINIDAMPGSMEIFNKKRPEDINLEIAISNKKDKLIYYGLNDPALNSFSKQLSARRNEMDSYKIIFSKELETRTLEDVFYNYLPKGIKIDFITIDVEGLDFEVLRSNNWNKYRSKVVLVESLENTLEDIVDNKVVKFMNANGYNIFAKTVNTLFFSTRF